MTCPFLEYRTTDDDLTFETARAYCTAADRFVQPMRADICNDRHDLDHAFDREMFRTHAGEAHSDGADETGPADREGDK